MALPRRYRPAGSSADKRVRGRKGMAMRRRRLQRRPLCAHCSTSARPVAAEEVDHIVPLHAGGTDTDDNVQCLCRACHAAKTARDRANDGAAEFYPTWLQPSAVPLVIVCGPPASGKTTYVQQHARPGDVVISLDDILIGVQPGYEHWAADLDRATLKQAIRIRNARLKALASATAGRAWFIVSAPAPAERRWWRAQLGGRIVLLDPGADECKRRAMARGTPRAVEGIDRWFARSRQRWVPPVAPLPRQAAAVGLMRAADGWLTRAEAVAGR